MGYGCCWHSFSGRESDQRKTSSPASSADTERLWPIHVASGAGRNFTIRRPDEQRDLAAVERQLQRMAALGPADVQRIRKTPRSRPPISGGVAPSARRAAAGTSGSAAQPAAAAPTPATPAATEEPILATIVPGGKAETAARQPAPAKPQAAAPAKPQAVAPHRKRRRLRSRERWFSARPNFASPPKPVPPPEPPPPPRRSWSEMLAGFMEERNIRWGELIGGLLIVGPAIALVISFWEQLAANPYLQLSTFVATCSAVFGVGLYAHHRWKLRSTSLGLLIIATLLVPLCFLAMAALWKESWGPGTIAADLATLAIFTGLVWCAARVLVPDGPWLQVIAVLGGSASILVAAHWLSPESADWWYVTAACLPVACFAAAIGAYLARYRRGNDLPPPTPAACSCCWAPPRLPC